MDEQHETAMANLVKSNEKDLEKYKRDTMQSFQDYLPNLKSKFLLCAQVAGGPFDIRKVSFDALSELIGAQLDFNVQFSFAVVWESFIEKWKSNLYFEEDLVETSMALTARCEGNGNEGEK
ncbi:hypothetical protein J1N35_034079 [Gossypium stocksii]|uniref:Uncharacterized protein n=1 Tax=Gossypium stocksii TaxID=47602 RepID=A0A9D3UT95_9ROSI|nr:hypothetical protein J1N35_034079 [Gossypium stocksii]